MRNFLSNPTGCIGRWLRHRSLRKQIRTIGKDLILSHGKKRVYTTDEIKSSWQDRGYALDFMCYAMAAYTSPSHFRDYHELTGEDCDYQSMRQELSDVCFNGNSNFTILDVYGVSSLGDGTSSVFSDMFSDSGVSTSDVDSSGASGGDGGSD